MRARWAALLFGVACSSSNPGGGGGGGSGVTGVTVAAPSKATSGLRFSLQATVQGTASNKDVVWTVEGGGTLGDASSNPATYTAPMVTAITTVRVKATSVADSAKSATQSIEVDPAPPLVAHVNPGVVPSQPSLPDRQGNPVPLGTSSDERGIQSEFIVGQVRVRPRNGSDSSAFLQRYDGTVIGDDTIPQRPASFGPPLTTEERAPKEFLVRINLARVDPSTFPADAAAVGLYGALDFSSTDALLSMAAATNALAQGFQAAPNFVEHPSGFPRTLLSTQERPIPAGGFEDALTKSPRFATTDGSQSNVTLAWQFVAAHGIARRVFVVILDGGFWLNTDGTAMGTDYDWPAKPIQYDFQSEDDFADGPNPNNCTGGNPCFWHGTGSAGTATGTLDNKQGAAGTGGLVADPVLFKFTGARDQRNRAIRTAVAWGADVLSMSFSGDCNKGCRIYDRDNAVFDDAIGSGSKIVFVASAGNDGNDVGDPHFVHPCIEDHTICVGALNDDAGTRISYSNFGGQVDIFAPTNIPVMSSPAGNDNDPAGTVAARVHTGTSASAPFVAGVVAMMKALNPGLDNDAVAKILHDTAHHGAAPVDNYIDAYAAVRAVAAGIPGVLDRLEPNNDASAAVGASASVGLITLLSFHTDTDCDFYRLNFSEPSRVTLNFSYAQALGALHVGDGYGLEADRPGCGEFSEESTTLGTDSQTLIYRVPAGSYLVEVSGKLNAYDWSFTKSPTLAPFVGPDGFEPDNLRSRAKDVGYGLHGTATLTSGDVDYFRITSMGTIDSPYLHSEFGFYVSRTDVPIMVEVTDVHGLPVGSAVGGTDCQGVVGVGGLPAGTFYVKVSARTAGQSGTYVFYGGVSAKGGTGPVHDRVYDRIHPGDPVEGAIFDRYKGYIFTLAPQVSQLGLSSQSLLHFQLLDVQGHVLTEGIAEDTHGQGNFERMSLANLSVGTDYLIQVNRVNAQVDSPPGTVPPANFTMGWASQASPTRDSGNLILNGDADDGNQGASDDGSVVALRFWVRPAGSNLTVVYYNSQGFPTFDDPIPPDHGFHFFAGGPANASSSADQTIDLAGNYASWFPAIDAGRATFNLSGWLGGYVDQDDASALSVTFVDASGRPLGTVTLGPVAAAERDNLTALLLRQTDGNVPPGTRLITVHLEMTRAGGAYNDGVADSLQLHLLDWTP